MVKTLHFRGRGLIPCRGAKILHAAWLKKKKKKEAHSEYLSSHSRDSAFSNVPYICLIKVCGCHCHLSCLDSKTTHIERHQSISFYEVFWKYCCSVAQSCPALCDPMGCSTPGFPVLQHLGELAQILVHWVSDAIQPCPCHHLLLLPSIFPSIRVFSNDPLLFLENIENYKEGNE